MFDLLHLVSAELGAVPHALIGAGAMSVAGYTRATQDLDLLALDPRVLDRTFWSTLEAAGLAVDIGDGRLDPTDPLLGVVRVVDDAGDQVDVVVGRHPRWQAPILTRARPIVLGGRGIPVAEPADLVLLKLHAGSRNDERDILELLRIDPRLRPLVDERVTSMPRAARERWQELRDEPVD